MRHNHDIFYLPSLFIAKDDKICSVTISNKILPVKIVLYVNQIRPSLPVCPVWILNALAFTIEFELYDQ